MDSKRIYKIVAGLMLFFILHIGCNKAKDPSSVFVPDDEVPHSTDTSVVPEETIDSAYADIPQSNIYKIKILQDGQEKRLPVFINTCPTFQLGKEDMLENDQYPLNIFKGRSISWADFSFSETITVEVELLENDKITDIGNVKILPSRLNVIPTVEGRTIRFNLTQPGQYSVELGNDGYKNGLMLFANPEETEKADTTSGQYTVLKEASKEDIEAVSASYSGIYFKKGIHHIGIYQVPAHIKEIYFEDGAWVYGAIIMDGVSGVKIYGRGVLSSAKMKYRETHCIESVNGSSDITIEGIVVADPKYFSVRLISDHCNVEWVKVIGGWVYNTDGIRVGANSSVSHSFIWANDDNIKVYRNNITFSDIVCWQLNNGGVIQLSWGNGNATNVHISNIDVLHAEWNTDATNRGVISCVGDKFAEGGMFGLQKNFLINNLTTETPVPIVFNIQPNSASPNEIHGMTFRNWNVKMDKSRGFYNYIMCSDPDLKFDDLVFDNFLFDNVKLTEENWMTQGRFEVSNIVIPTFN